MHSSELVFLIPSERVVEAVEALLASGHSLLKPGGSLFIEDAAGVLLKGGKSVGHLILQDTRKMGSAALQHWRLR